MTEYSMPHPLAPPDSPTVPATNARYAQWLAVMIGFISVSLLAPAPSRAQESNAAERDSGGVVIDEVIARVNDDIITRFELQRAAIPFLMQEGEDPSALDDPQRREEIYQRVLQDMVDRKLLVEKAREMDLSIKDQQVQQWLKYTRQQRGLSAQQFRQAIEQYGISFEAYRNLIRQNLLKYRLVKVQLGSQISISNEEVDEAYREQFGSAEGVVTKRKISHILVQPESQSEEDLQQARATAEKALARLKKGKSFEKLAENYSDGPSAKRGGFLGTFAPGELNPDFESAIENIEAGEHTDVVQTQHGFHIIRVDEIVKQQQSNVQRRKKQIRQQLRQQAIEDQLDNYVKTLREQSFVEVMYESRN